MLSGCRAASAGGRPWVPVVTLHDALHSASFSFRHRSPCLVFLLAEVSTIVNERNATDYGQTFFIVVTLTLTPSYLGGARPCAPPAEPALPEGHGKWPWGGAWPLMCPSPTQCAHPPSAPPLVPHPWCAHPPGAPPRCPSLLPPSPVRPIPSPLSPTPGAVRIPSAPIPLEQGWSDLKLM